MAPIPFSLPPEIRQSLGDIVIAWARVDALLAEFLSFLLKADRGAMYVLNQDVAGSTQLKWIRTLVDDRYQDDNLKKALNALFGRIDDARGERNAYIHGLWKPGPENGTAIVQTLKLGRAEIIREDCITAPDLNELFSEIVELSEALYEIGTTLKFVT